jgi:CIC family chloride channel protein
MALALPAFALGRCLLAMIEACGQLFFNGHLSSSPLQALATLKPWQLLVPALGGLAVGCIARYGTPAVRGHGIPEVIQSVLAGESKVPLKVALLKPVCAAISIGSGGPFGAEGPVIGLGGSLGSLCGQWLEVSAWERKVMLASGAAAGITAVFGCPVAATLLALELLLYEFTPPSLMAVGLASTVAATLRVALMGNVPVFPMPLLAQPQGWALASYVALGLPLGLASAGIIRLVSLMEGLYKKLPMPWMFWPMLGGLAVGLLALAEPRVLGPSYDSIADTLNGNLAAQALALFFVLKLAAWVIALGSGTTGGTLAPLFAIGGAAGGLLTWVAALAFPALGLDPRMGALVGMAAVFAGASRALLASILMVLETTHQVSGTLPLFGACLISSAMAHWLLPHSLMTESLHQQGIHVPRGWSAEKNSGEK